MVGDKKHHDKSAGCCNGYGNVTRKSSGKANVVKSAHESPAPMGHVQPANKPRPTGKFQTVQH